MKLFRRIWLWGLGLGGAIVILTRETTAAVIGLPAQTGPWILLALGVTLIALAIAPRFLFRRD